MTINRKKCKRCEGEGDVLVCYKLHPMTGELIPKTKECPVCLGTGFDTSADAMKDDV